jgi:SAM-dependent methyltransferase
LSNIHPAARHGFAEAATYQRGRPDYPQELIPWLRDELRLGPGKRVIDLGAGTGKFTRLLLETEARVIAALNPFIGSRQLRHCTKSTA